MPSFFEFLERPIPDKITDILMIMGLSSTEAFKHTLAQLLGDKERVTKEELEKYSIIACGTKNIANTAVPLTADDVLSIYRRSFLD